MGDHGFEGVEVVEYLSTSVHDSRLGTDTVSSPKDHLVEAEDVVSPQLVRPDYLWQVAFMLSQESQDYLSLEL